MSSTAVQHPRPAQSATAVRTLHYVFSTHWDREWYQPFQRYRMRLVALIDGVLRGMDEGSFRGPFQTDGQTILVEDYLEVRPERRERLASLARSGRLVLGPWYVLPDEFLVSGESIIRNLRMGRTTARALGVEPSKAGFVCDLFGHISQLPQILAGFGVKGVFLWRGVNPRGTRHLWWVGADGTHLPAYHFGRRGYCDYASNVRWADRHDARPDDEQLAHALDNWLNAEMKLSAVEPVLLFDGGDHQAWDQDAYGRVSDMLENRDDVSWVHSSLDAYVDEMLQQTDRIEQTIHGELREPGREPMAVDEQWVIPGVASSRVWIKQANAQCQSLLTQWAEPFAAMAHFICDSPQPDGLLHIAWKWLLKNHPHDSIGGCSIDQVHRDMAFRFSQCQQIGEGITDDALYRLAVAQLDPSQRGRLHVGVFNPLPIPRDEVVELSLEIPSDWPTYNEFFGFEPKHAFRLKTVDGTEVPYQLLAQQPGRKRTRLKPTRFPEVATYTEVRIAARVVMPAMGGCILAIEPAEAGEPTRYPNERPIAQNGHMLENAILRVEADDGGTLTILDKRTDRRFSRLLSFEDAADIGDGWYHGQAVADRVIRSDAVSSAVARIASGPHLGRLEIRTRLQVPRAFDRTRSARSEECIELALTSEVTLRADCPFLEVTTTVDNQAKDHRLRVLFPSGCHDAEHATFDSAFDAVDRPVALRKDNHTYRELEVETRPQQSWTRVQDADGGLAVIALGLCEAAVCDEPNRPIALTLFRSTGTTVFTDGEPDGQLLGPMRFSYRIVPTLPGTSAAELSRLSADLHGGLRAVHVHPDDLTCRSDLPAPADCRSASLLSVAGDVGISAMLAREDGLEVRLFNPGDADVHATLQSTAVDLRGATVTPLDLAGDPIGDAETCEASAYDVHLGPKKIVTLLVTPKGARP